MSSKASRVREWFGSRRGPHEGQILVIFALAAVALVLAVGLVIDGGNAFLNRRSAQNASDLAALAGTQVIADFYTKVPNTTTSADVYGAIQARMTANDCTSSGATPCSWSASFVDKYEAVTGDVLAGTSAIPAGSQGVIVHVTREPGTYFLGLINQGKWTVITDATALTARQTTAPPGALLPIGINPPTASEYDLFTLTEGSSFGPGNFGWLSWTGANATGILATSICSPDNPLVSIGDWIPGEPGVHNGSDVRACLDKWIASGATVLVPLWSTCSACNGNNAQYQVVGFASFILDSYTISHGAINTLIGRFQGVSSLTSVPAGTGDGPPQAGDISVSLGLVR